MIHKLIKFVSKFYKSIYSLRIIQNILLKSKSKVIFTSKNNIKFELFLGDMIPNYIYHFSIWEPYITNYIESKINCLKERSFIDIGSNIGYFSLLVGIKNKQCIIYSYEPNQYLLNHFKRNVALNNLDNIILKNCAISDSNECIKLFEGHELNSGSTGIFDKDNLSKSFWVNSTTLAHEIRNYQFPPKLIKIDTEGSEYFILKNFSNIISILPDDVEFIVEINPEIIGKYKANKIIENFQNHSFNAFELKNNYDFSFYRSAHDYKISKLNSAIKTQTDILFKR